MDQLKKILKSVLPPIVISGAKRALQRNQKPSEWEFASEGWQATKLNPAIKGWDVASIAQTYEKKWSDFLRELEGAKPLGVNHEATVMTHGSLRQHNLVMSFAYVLSLAAQSGSASGGKNQISFLDWGGGIGHYYMIAKALFPKLLIAYTCKELPAVCQAGPKFVPQGRFDATENCLLKKYDLVMASTSLHYSKNWDDTFKKLAGATDKYLYITRLPVVEHTPSFVILQRPQKYGYDTEYLGWCLNKSEFLKIAQKAGMKLLREFLIGEQTLVKNAPEQPQYQGFLFEPIKI